MLSNNLKNCIVAVCITVASMALTAGVSHAAPAFPEGTWDFTITGKKVEGMAYLTFLDDPTWGRIVHGYILIKPVPFLKAANGPAEIHLGFFEVEGSWTIANGVVTGFFSGGSETVPLDNSFTATGSSLKMSMNANGTNDLMKLKGIPINSPAVPTTDLTGDWSAQVTKNGQKATELFTLAPHADPILGTSDFCIFRDVDPDPLVEDFECVLSVPAPNLFDVVGAHPDGGGPGYDLLGSVALSSGNKIGVVLEELHIDKDSGDVEQPGNGTVRGVIGNFSTKTFKATMKGTDTDAINALIPTVLMTISLIP